MKLHPIHAMGISAYCSDMIIDPYDLDTVYLMSICGYQATVKGILANLLEDYGVSIDIGGHEYYLARSGFSYKTRLKKLPSGLVHAVVFPLTALPEKEGEKENDFCVFREGNGDVLGLFFRHLDEKTEIPLHPSWANWLWETFMEQEGWLLELKTLAGTYCGYSFTFNPGQLHDIISEAIRKKVPEIIQCMKWRGGEENGKSDFAQGFLE
ncbi:conserved hypothetical protein [uncultured Desulfatiglans sp.]|uniref:Uncharacterized protein n=1 Tax=Uncultured Desulfatiglans sp. TaxID=1748965 RepID=A0A653AAC7_UNCDX|nr:conserved hypothetical protein [uncultured Desulfatiglans sp.]